MTILTFLFLTGPFCTGCIMDYCADKRQVSLKLRTADICADCLDAIRQAGIDPNVVNHVLNILEEIRRNMLFKSRWSFDPKPLVLSVEGEGRELYFPELSSLKIELRPLQRALYLFYLEHPDGVPFSQLHRYEDDIFKIYSTITGKQWHEVLDREQYDQARHRIRNLVDINNNPTRNRSIKYISEAFEQAVGPDAAGLYCISGPTGGNRKIAVDRQYVQYRER